MGSQQWQASKLAGYGLRSRGISECRASRMSQVWLPGRLLLLALAGTGSDSRHLSLSRLLM